MPMKARLVDSAALRVVGSVDMAREATEAEEERHRKIQTSERGVSLWVEGMVNGLAMDLASNWRSLLATLLTDGVGL